MKPTTPPIIALCSAFLIGNLGAAISAARPGVAPAGFLNLYHVAVAWALSWWVLTDSRLRRIPTSIDKGWFVFIAWPIAVPYHVVRTRGSKGCLFLLALVGMFATTYAVALAVFALLSTRWP